MPRILIYNPTCEIAIGKKADNYSAPPHLATFERDMAQIMMYMSDADDMIVAHRPDAELTDMLSKAGIALPHFCSLAEAKAALTEGYELQPWGKCRPVYRALGLKTEATAFDDNMRSLHSRQTSVELEKIIAQADCPHYMQPSFTPEVITNSNLTIADLKAHLPLVLKSVWSSSGRGVMLVRDESQLTQALTFAQGRIRHDGAIIAEPLLSRISECSFLFAMREGQKPQYLGCNTFEADPLGNFGYEMIGRETPSLLPNNWQTEASQVLTRALQQWQEQTGYTGYIGFDAMIYDHSGQPHLRLCTEANLRICMGNINLGVARLFASDVQARWTIRHFGQAGEALDYCHRQSVENPLRVNADGKIVSGFFRLTSVGEETHFVACGEVLTKTVKHEVVRRPD